MARLEGQKSSTGPIIVGAIIIALVAAGMFFAFRPASEPVDTTGTATTTGNTSTDNTVSNEVSAENSVSTDATPIEGGGSSTPIPEGTAGASGGGGGGTATNSASSNSASSSAPGDSGVITAGTPSAQPTQVQILPTATSRPPQASGVPVPTVGGNMAGGNMAGRPGATPGANNPAPIGTVAPLTSPRAGATAVAPPPVSTPAPVPTIAGTVPRTQNNTGAASRPPAGY